MKHVIIIVLAILLELVILYVYVVGQSMKTVTFVSLTFAMIFLIAMQIVLKSKREKSQ